MRRETIIKENGRVASPESVFIYNKCQFVTKWKSVQF